MKSILLIAVVMSASMGAVRDGDDSAEPRSVETPVADTNTGTVTGMLQSVWLRRYSMIVYLEEVKESDDDEVAYEAPEEMPVLDQKNKMFMPHVIPAIRGTTIKYVNHDDVKHNVYFVQPDGETLNLGTGTEDWSREHTMEMTGTYMHRCNVHDEMSAYIVVLDNPFFKLIDKGAKKKSAEFVLEGVPAGQYKLHVWCEKYFDDKEHKFNRTWDVTVTAGEETRIDIKP